MEGPHSRPVVSTHGDIATTSIMGHFARPDRIGFGGIGGALRGAMIATDVPFGSSLVPAISSICFPGEAEAATRFAEMAAITAGDGGQSVRTDGKTGPRRR